MTLKALAALNWIVTYCRHATYFLKADDDAFVNVFAALKHLGDLQSAGYRRRLLMCLVWQRAPVARRGKWAVSPDEFAGRRYYPTYCCGLGYIVTGDVVDLLLSAAATHHHHPHARPNPPFRSNVTPAGNLPPHNDVTDNDVTGNSRAHDVTAGRRFWIDDVYVTGMLVEALGDRIRHTNMSAAYCKSDKMAAVYRSVSEWYKYIFTQVGDDEGRLYRDTWNALRQRAANATIPSPSVIRPGCFADRYIPLSVMLQRANTVIPFPPTI